jgi:hypothetical protein
VQTLQSSHRRAGALANSGEPRYGRAVPDNVDPQIRKTVSLPASLWRQVGDWQFERGIKREGEALRLLLRRGLAAAQRSVPTLATEVMAATPGRACRARCDG